MEAAQARFGTIERMAERIYSEPVPTRAVAGFAADVGAARSRGRARAAILRDAARELAISACAAAGRLFEPEEPVVVSYTGNVFQAAALIMEPFTREVEALRSNASVVPPSGRSARGRVPARGGWPGLAAGARHPRDVVVTDALERMRGGLVVSVQAAPGRRSRRPSSLRRSRARRGGGGAVGIRTEGLAAVTAIRRLLRCP